MPSEHDVRQRAVICQDCWFWKEMSCALASPVDGVCANKRPVQGRRAAATPAQASLVPLAAGHARPEALPVQPAARVAAPTAHAAPAAHVAALHAAPEPFATDAPEATFSMAQLRAEAAPARQPATSVDATMQPIRTSPPSFREIRAGRAAAASRAPVAEVRIPVSELEGGTLISDAARHERPGMTPVLPGMDQLVERVRQRTAARLGRAGTFSPA